MIFFWRLVLAHLLADFTFQTDKIAEWKRKNLAGVFIHTLIFAVLAFLSVCIYDPFSNKVFSFQPLTGLWWRFPAWISILLLSIIHFVEDYYRIWSIKGGSHDSIFFFLWDQFIHIFLIFLFAPSLSINIPERLIVVLVLLVLATHFTTVFIYYLEESVYGSEDISIRFGNKYNFILLRLIVFCSLLFPGFWVLVTIVTGFIGYKSLIHEHKHKFTNLNLILSMLIAVILGILARLVLYN
jgi:hypothetical protein